MAHWSHNDKQPHFLRDFLDDADIPKESGNALERYLTRLNTVYSGFHEPVHPNRLLDHYLNEHDIYQLESIDLTSSKTELPAPPAAVKAASAAAESADHKMYGNLGALLQELEQLAKRGQAFEGWEEQVKLAKKQGVELMSGYGALKALKIVLDGLEAGKLDLIRKVYQKRHGTNAALEQIIDACVSDNIEQKQGNRQLEAREVKQHIVEFILLACDEQLHGTLSHTEGFRSEFTRKKAVYEKALRKAPSDHELANAALETKETLLKPAIMNLMQHLQGVDAQKIKPTNLCICKDSSTHILDTALKELIESPKKSWRHGAQQQKKLLQFSMSWDGLKTYGIEMPLDLSLVEGSVNAEALEAHIQQVILKDHDRNDLSQARAEVRKQVGALVMNIPENPLGKIPSDDEMKALAKVIDKYDIPVVIVDEIFAAPGHRSLITYPEMEKHCYVISSTSKNLKLADKVAFGYSANDEFAKRVNHALQGNQPDFIMTAAYAALIENLPADYWKNNQQQYAQKRDAITKVMGQVNQKLGLSEGLSWLMPPNYGCLGVITVPRTLTDQCGIKDSCALSEYLYKLTGVMAMPTGDVTPSNNKPIGVRINFSGDDGELKQAIQRLGVGVQYMQEKKAYQEIEGNNHRKNQMHGGTDIEQMFREMLLEHFRNARDGHGR